MEEILCWIAKIDVSYAATKGSHSRLHSAETRIFVHEHAASYIRAH